MITTMTQADLTKTIRVPIWAVMISVVIAISLLAFAYRGAVLQGQMVEQVKNIRTEAHNDRVATGTAIINLTTTKADRREVDRLYDTLERIERKLDDK